jgi:hypothetical protein
LTANADFWCRISLEIETTESVEKGYSNFRSLLVANIIKFLSAEFMPPLKQANLYEQHLTLA